MIENAKRPNFFILGAPKCGTTSLASWLAQHPNVYMSPIKEPHFFNRDGMVLTGTLEEYEALFAGVTMQQHAIGEASTHYLYSRQAVPGILEYNPAARFIVCIRNPIEMAPSLHSERVWQGVETEKDFEKAWCLQPLRKRGRFIPATVRADPERLQYGLYCCLGEQISRLYSLVPAERVLVLVLDDLAAQPRCEYERVLRFLDVPGGVFTPEFAVQNQRKAVRWPFLSFTFRYLSQLRRSLGFRKPINLYGRLQSLTNTALPEKAPLSKEMKAELRAYFEEDICLLGHLLDRDFSSWLSP